TRSGCRSPPGSSASATSRPAAWRSRSRASPRSRPGRTRGWSPRSSRPCSPTRPAPRRPEMARGRKREIEEEHENHERWLISYADMITVLMALFIVLFAMSQVDETKYQELKESLRNGFGQSGAMMHEQASVLDGQGRTAISSVTSDPE